MKVFGWQASTCKSTGTTASAHPVKKAATRQILLNGTHSAALTMAGE
jgi:hypothetical protein